MRKRLLIIVLVLLCIVTIFFQMANSIELNNDGVLSLVWVKPKIGRVLPRLERVILKWEDIKKWKMMNNGVIYLYSSKRRVVINTLLFKDKSEVIKFINKATNAK